MEKSPRSIRERRPRTKTSSSLEGMMLGETSSSSCATSSSSSMKLPSSDNKEDLVNLTRKLRRAKRKLLLKSAETPSNGVDLFRGMVLQLSLDSGESDAQRESASSVYTKDSFKTLFSSLGSNDENWEI